MPLDLQRQSDLLQLSASESVCTRKSETVQDSSRSQFPVNRRLHIGMEAFVTDIVSRAKTHATSRYA
jgi:hypothetical protein